MIEAVRLCYSHAAKVKGSAALQFKPGLNILVGPNGSGKSTVLRALNSCGECRKEESGTKLYFNSETMNPHATEAAPGGMREMILKVRGVFSSHGEIMKAALASLPIHKGDTLLVDEPEAGQDLEGIQTIRKGFDLLCKQGCQVIAATHHPLLLADANIIELVPGYVQKVQTIFCRAVCD